jgi:hypothetical protein
MSVQRVEQILRYSDAMVDCYENRLSLAEQQALHAWELSEAFTRTDDWPGWGKYLGPRPGTLISRPVLMRRLA